MYLSSWSGGKDSCFACYRALRQGMKISHFVHFDRALNLHGVDPALVRLQAELAGIPIVQRKVVSDDFEREFKDTVAALRKDGARGMVFGDIYLEPHKEWVVRVCRELGLEAVEPLWGMKTEGIMEDFLKEGFETVVVSGKQELIGKEWIGRKMDKDFIGYLASRKLDVCGENGEFHTFVTSGPLFHGKIEIVASGVTSKNGFWFLDIRGYQAVK